MKVSLIGAGNIGGVLALLLTNVNLEQLVLYDVVEGLPQGKALDLSHASGLLNFRTKIIGTNDLRDIVDSQLCIVTAGVARKPGMSRDDLLKTNASIIKSVAEGIKSYSPGSAVIVVTNPLDAMTWLMFKITNLPKNKVVGMAGVLDSARYAFHIGEAAAISPSQVKALVLGGHGDDMVTARSLTRIEGIPVERFLSGSTLSELEGRVKNAGAEIVGLLKTGSAFFSPAAACYKMAESILFDTRAVLPCSCYLEGEYGLKDIFMGTPCVLAKGGVERVLEIDLSATEREQFLASAKRVEQLISELRGVYGL